MSIIHSIILCFPFNLPWFHSLCVFNRLSNKLHCSLLNPLNLLLSTSIVFPWVVLPYVVTCVALAWIFLLHALPFDALGCFSLLYPRPVPHSFPRGWSPHQSRYPISWKHVLYPVFSSCNSSTPGLCPCSRSVPSNLLLFELQRPWAHPVVLSHGLYYKLDFLE